MTTLETQLRRANRRRRVNALLLVLPLLGFVLVFFIAPLGAMLVRSVHQPELADLWPRTAGAVAAWDGTGVPGEGAFAALAADMQETSAAKTVARAASRLNFERSGMRSMVVKTARDIANATDGPFMPIFIASDARWGEHATWATIKLVAQRYSATKYLAAVDMRYDENFEIVPEAEENQIYVMLFERTLWVAGLVTLICFVLGYPVAWLLATSRPHIANLLMILVLLPFWTSLLVRTTAWIALLQSQGILNDMMVWAGVLDEESRIQMIYNMTGTLVAMTHILLPFMILPLYSVMKTIPPTYVRAARSLGAGPVTAFARVYFPMTLPGVGAGAILVFILAIGYYITPALVGGRTGQLISNMIAFHMQSSLNWGLAAAIGGILLFSVIVLYLLFNKIAGVDRLRFG